MVDPIAEAVEYCNTVATKYGAEQGENNIFKSKVEFYTTIGNYCQQRLWHQLTTTVLEYVSHANNNSSDCSDFLSLYENIILKFYTKIHPLSTARIVTYVANYQLSVALSSTTSTSSMDTDNNNTVSVEDAAKALLDNLIVLFNEQIEKARSLDNDPYRSSANKKKNDTAMNYKNATLFLQSKRNLLTLYVIQMSGSSTSTGSSTTTATSEKDSSSIEEKIKLIVKDMKRNALLVHEWSSVVQKSSTAATVSKVATTKEVSDVMTDMSIVLSAHYEQCMTYYKIYGPPELFYEQAMQYITYSTIPTDIDTIDSTTSTSTSSTKSSIGTIDYYQFAIDICLAALTGDGVYNLGEVEQTPCLRLLSKPANNSTGVDYSWLVQLVQAVSLGNVTEFQNITTKYTKEIQNQPALTLRSSIIEEKLTLMALIEYIVSAGESTSSGMDIDDSNVNTTTNSNKRGGGGTTIVLDDVAVALHRPVDQIEYVIMRACSVNLIKATIDQVDNIALITYIMPRVLNASQMITLANQFNNWNIQLSNMEQYMKDHTQTLFA